MIRGRWRSRVNRRQEQVQVGRVDGVFLGAEEGDEAAVGEDEDVEEVEVLQERGSEGGEKGGGQFRRKGNQ